jgi:hypothetical protein
MIANTNTRRHLQIPMVDLRVVPYFLFHPRSPSHVSNVYRGSQPKISFALRMLVTGQNSSQVSL